MATLQPQTEGLSKRAVEILHLLAEGLSDRDIAERLFMTVNTIKWYNRQIYSILGVANRTHAIIRARELQLLEDKPTPAVPEVRHAPKHNLPVESTHFIGRKHEMAAIQRLLETAHLLTLVGPPGTGKTRLALQIGWAILDTFRDGVYFVSLAPISDTSLVATTIASTLAVNERHGQTLLETLKQVLCDSQILLILDNFEHLLAAAAQVSELLASAPHLKVLATSREPLHLYGEHEYAVPSLDLPDLEDLDPQTLQDCESIALFVQQARAVQSNFELTQENALDIAKICVSLDGLPLAIELAAARVKLFAPQTLLSRLSNRLNTLTSGVRDVPQRHQTLRDALDWSFDLLTDYEKLLFSRLSVFTGGGSLDAIEDVCGMSLKIDVLDCIDSLLNKSLLKVIEQGLSHNARFVMLETVQEYAREKLGQSDESFALYVKHTEWFVSLAERAEPELRGKNQKFWMDNLAVEEANFRAILNGCRNGLIDPEFGLRLVGSLQHFWQIKGNLKEGGTWLNEMLLQTPAADRKLRAKALCAAGDFAYHRGDFDRVVMFCNQALEISRQIGDKQIAAQAVHFLAHVAQHAGNYVEGEKLLSQSLTLSREIGDLPWTAQALNCLGDACRLEGDYEKGRALMEEALAIYRELRHPRSISVTLNNLGMLLQRLGEYDQASAYLHEALTLALEINNESTFSFSLIGLAGLSVTMGYPERAALLLGMASAMHERSGTSPAPTDRIDYEAYLTANREQLNPTIFKALRENGQAMSFQEVKSYVKREILKA